MAFYNNEVEYNNFLIKYNLNPNQFDFLWKMTHRKHKQIKLDRVYALFNELNQEVKVNDKIIKAKHSKYITKEEIDELEMKGYLKPVLKSSKFPDGYDVTEKFYGELFKDSTIAFQELYESYPEFLNIKGEQFNARSCDFEELERLYKKKLGNSLKYHDRILEELSNQIKLELINMKLENWVKSEGWKLNTISKNQEIKGYGITQVK